MGDPKRQRKKYITPGHPWQKERLLEEMQIVGKYGLRNKRELWRQQALLKKYRSVAKDLLGMPEEKRAALEEEVKQKLYRLGILQSEDATIDDILRLTVETFLERRLQTVVYKLGLAKTIYQARQLITHGHIQIGNQVVSSPGYIVKRGEEEQIKYATGSSFANPDHPLRKELSGALNPSEGVANE